MSADPRISVVVPTHDDGELLNHCLASIFAQTPPPFEVIVVDDGTVAPAALRGIDRAMARHPRTRLLRQPASGPSGARNRGVAACTGDFVAFVDCDDELLPDNLARKHALLGSAPQAVASFAGIIFKPAQGGEFRSVYPPRDGWLDPALIGHRGGVPGFLWAYLFRIDALRATGGLDEALRHMEDFDLLARLGRAGGRVVGCNDPLYRQHRRRESLSRASGLAQARGALTFLAKARRNRYFGPVELARRYARVPYAALKIMLRRR